MIFYRTWFYGFYNFAKISSDSPRCPPSIPFARYNLKFVRG